MGQYIPFEEQEIQKDTLPLSHRLVTAIDLTTGIPHGTYSKDFLIYMNAWIERNQGVARKSPLRILIEGGFPDVPLLTKVSAQQWRRKLRDALLLADFAESIAYECVEKQLKGLDAVDNEQVKRLKKSFGGVKLPRLMEAVIRGKKSSPRKKVK